MKRTKRNFLAVAVLLFGLAGSIPVQAGQIVSAAQTASSQEDIQVEIISPEFISATPIYNGEAEIKITNNGTAEASGLSCYLSVVDQDRKQSFPMDEFGENSYQTREIDSLKMGESTTIKIPLRIMYVGNFRIVANVVDYDSNQVYASNALMTTLTSVSSLNKPLVIAISIVVPIGLVLLSVMRMGKRGYKKAQA